MNSNSQNSTQKLQEQKIQDSTQKSQEQKIQDSTQKSQEQKVQDSTSTELLVDKLAISSFESKNSNKSQEKQIDELFVNDYKNLFVFETMKKCINNILIHESAYNSYVNIKIEDIFCLIKRETCGMFGDYTSNEKDKFIKFMIIPYFREQGLNVQTYGDKISFEWTNQVKLLVKKSKPWYIHHEEYINRIKSREGYKEFSYIEYRKAKYGSETGTCNVAHGHCFLVIGENNSSLSIFSTHDEEEYTKWLHTYEAPFMKISISEERNQVWLFRDMPFVFYYYDAKENKYPQHIFPCEFSSYVIKFLQESNTKFEIV